jgi:hypothetical protein
MTNNLIPFVRNNHLKPAFNGVINFEECHIELDFADLLVHVFSQLPERSQNELMNHLEKISALVDHVKENGDEKTKQILESLGYFLDQ